MIFAFIMLLLIMAFSFTLFGITGIRVVVGIVFISLPLYLILNNLDLTQGEKFVFSVLLGITIFPSLVYILGFVVSFRVSIFIVFLVLLIVSYLTKRFWKK